MNHFCAYFCLLFVFLNVLSFILCQSCLEGEKAKEYNDKMVKYHNEYRIQHGTPLLQPNAKLMEAAIQWSKGLVVKGVLEHSGPGENLYMKISSDSVDMSGIGSDAVKSWYDEIKFYKKAKFSKEAGHFTQLVWRDSRKLGCGMCSYKDRAIITCRYSPAGNVAGQFEENVPRLKLTEINEATTLKLRTDIKGATPADMGDTTATTWDLSNSTEETTLSVTPQLDGNSNILEMIVFVIAIIVLIVSLLPVGILLSYMCKRMNSRR